MKKFLEKYPDTEIRALTWKQPFASLMLAGKIETRTWNTNYRGWVLICAAQKAYSLQGLNDIAGESQILRIEDTLISTEIKNGVALAIGRLVECREMTPQDSDKCFVEYISPWLSISRNYYTERQLWCHIYEDVTRITPFEYKGHQGWRTLDKELIDKIIIQDAAK